MHQNEALIHQFYSAFQQRDSRMMGSAYADEAIFFDPVFGQLDARSTRAMWEMLCLNARDFSLTYSDVIADDDYGNCNWTAKYTFSQTGRPVENRVKAHFRFMDGEIWEHQDDFNFYRWSRQALGLPGWILGWNGMLQNKVRKKALASLEKFMNKK